jgi:hypothetical protein
MECDQEIQTVFYYNLSDYEQEMMKNLKEYKIGRFVDMLF